MQIPEALDEVTTHDLVQPLAAIKLESDILARRLRDGSIAPGELAAGLEAISDRAGLLAEQLAFQLSHTDTETEALHLAPCDLVDLVMAGLTTLRPEELARVTLDASSPVPGIWDAVRMKQLVLNLVSNALKYGRESVIVTIRATDDAARLDVEDDGIGLTSEEIAMLFTRGYRSARAAATGVAGLGFGLSGCRAIVEAHGGRIWAESRGAGTGSRFSASFPLVAP